MATMKNNSVVLNRTEGHLDLSSGMMTNCEFAYIYIFIYLHVLDARCEFWQCCWLNTVGVRDAFFKMFIYLHVVHICLLFLLLWLCPPLAHDDPPK